MLNDLSYAERARDERRLAMASANPAARVVHLELAAKYAALAGANPDRVPALRVDERKTA